MKTREKPITKKTFESIVKEWLKFAKYHEIGFFVWPPPLGASWRVTQFIKDRKLQMKLGLTKQKIIFVYLDLRNDHTIKEEKFRKFLYLRIKDTAREKNIYLEKQDLNGALDILASMNYDTVLFISGVEYDIQFDNLKLLKLTASLQETYINSLAVLVFTSAFLESDNIKEKMFQKHTLRSNIFYKPLWSKEDTESFLDYIVEKWKLKLSNDQKKWIFAECTGSLGLVKNALRLIRNNPKITVNEIENDSSMFDRAKNILTSIPVTASKIIGKKIRLANITTEAQNTISYLERLNMVGSLDTFRLNPNYLNKVHAVISIGKSESLSPELIFSKPELNLFQLFTDKLGYLVNREDIAKTIWGSNWEENYSEWAIDQTIHRLRLKIKKAHMGYKILTKKGQGFILQEK